jgi:cell wall-associated protease
MKDHLLITLLSFSIFFGCSTINIKHNKNYVINEKDDFFIKKRTFNSQRNIIVAVLDSQLDITHKVFKNKIWVNKNEIANNNIDDDKNGYTDDVNGWNFVGKSNGGFFSYGNFEHTRIIQKYSVLIKNQAFFNYDSLSFYTDYKKAKIKLENQLDFYRNWKNSIEFHIVNNKKVKDTLRFFLKKDDYTIFQLDSLYNIYKINDKSFYERKTNNDQDLGALIDYMRVRFQTKRQKIEDLMLINSNLDSIINKNLNINFVDRKYISDNPNVLNEKYGNPNIFLYPALALHSTEVSSLIISNRLNEKGINEYHDNIKIMPLCISTSGDEHDKDIAMAIYYAVDNGAKVINMSFGKEFSLNQKWVSDAFKYAEDHNVLIVHSSGNNNFNVDVNRYYPSDLDYFNKKELVGNFINVGSISKRTDSTMVSPFSNYGKENVDLFAPGEEIYVAKPNNEYGYDSGTSLAGPMVSGTAALIWLCYPKLTVHQVKNIILESGITIDKMVVKPGTKDEMVPFSDLCKTGKVLNTYNAMQLAKKISKQKQ